MRAPVSDEIWAGITIWNITKHLSVERSFDITYNMAVIIKADNIRKFNIEVKRRKINMRLRERLHKNKESDTRNF